MTLKERPDISALLQQYVPAFSSFNELYSGNEGISPDWKTLFSSLLQLDSKEIESRSNSMLRLLKENGVAYNVYEDSNGQTRPWELDIIPHLITAHEWETTNAGLVQRAELLNLLLKDIYGRQTLIKEGVIPQELIYMHPGFLRSCANISLPHDQYLILYAADMARSSDGRLWIISDRTQAPSGSGYALENRFALSSILPELFSNMQVRRLSPYFDALQSAFNGIAPHRGENPRVVILTPGPENETYFEHSYLASYLGLTLVQGDDLMIKDNFVWLKTIEGLEKVDVILRRMDDIYCDPLELKSDSLLGTPGLLHVIRKGNVAIANPLGSSVVENAGLVPFLPAAAKHFFGTDLLMPSIATWWCGQPKEMQYVFDNLSYLVIRRIFRKSKGHSTIDGSSLSSTAAADLVKEIRANPYLYTGQEKITFSSSPTWANGKVQAGHALIRNFLVSHKGSYLAMPGGLTRSSQVKDNFIISNQTGDISKDTWVLSSGDEQESMLKLQIKTDEVNSMRIVRSLPSQTAENLFWVGRYTERVIYNARLLRTVMKFIVRNNTNLHVEGTDAKNILLQAVTACTYTSPGFLEAEENGSAEKKLFNPWIELTDILYNEDRPGGLTTNLSHLKRAVYSVRNFWSTDTWRVLQQIEENWEQAKSTNYQDHFQMVNAVESLNTSMFAFLGMNRESVRREQGWNIFDLGRKIEQVLYIINLLRCIVEKRQSAETEHDVLEALLESTQSLITYRYTYQDHLQLPLVLELMILDLNYPKSLAYLVHKIKRYISILPKTGKDHPPSQQERLILEAYTMLILTKGINLAQPDGYTNRYKALESFLDKLYSLIAETSVLVSKTYFRHTVSQKQLFISNIL